MLFGSTILEIAIGVIFFYLLLSLLCSALGEYIEAKFNNRAKYLRQGIELLLNDTTGKGTDIATLLYGHGLVRPLYRDKNRLPSYIPSRTFALALWNMATALADDQSAGHAAAMGVVNDLPKIRDAVARRLPNEELKTALLTLIDEANGDITRARTNIEEWYNAMMDRVSGWYKRRTSVIMLVLGFVLAAIVNADTINVVNVLARDEALRSSLVAAAQQQLETPTPAPNSAGSGTPQERDDAATERLRRARANIATLGLPIGWIAPAQTNQGDPRRWPQDAMGWLVKLCGILITGFAVSQGAPFWFDILNKFIVVRSTVKPAEKSGEQPSKDKPAPQTALERPPADDMVDDKQRAAQRGTSA